MRALVAIAVGLFLPPSPASELHAAVVDAATLATQDRPHVRYLTTYNLPEEDRADARDVVDFWLNSLSRRRTITRAQAITDSVLRIDMRDYDWPAEAWETLVQARGYEFVPIYANTKGTAADPIGTRSPILRADAWLAYSSDHPHYTDFLRLPDTVAKLFEDQRIREDDVQALHLEIAGSKVHSGVALHNRRLIRWPTLAGYFWKSEDHLTDFAADSVLENVLKTDVDAGEYIWSLPNGLQAYYIADRDGKLVRVVPADIAQDYQTASRDKQIYNARSCVGCHSLGINKFVDDVSSLMDAERIELRTRDREKALAIEERYVLEREPIFAEDLERYARAVRLATGRHPEEIAGIFARLIWSYRDRPVDLETACRELGISTEQLASVAIPYGPDQLIHGTVASLLAGRTVPRAAWEDLIGDVVLLLASKGTAP